MNESNESSDKQLMDQINDLKQRISYLEDLQNNFVQLKLKYTENEYFLKNLENVLPCLIYIYDIINEKILHVTEQCNSFLGYSQNEIINMGSDFFKVIHPDDVKSLKSNKACLSAQDGEVLTRQYKMKDKSGFWRWFESKDMVYKRSHDFHPKELLGTSIDISALKEAEEQIKIKDSIINNLVDENKRLKEQFLGYHASEAHRTSQFPLQHNLPESFAEGFFHHFGNLLNVIRGFSDIMIKDINVSPEKINDLIYIKQAADKSIEIIRKLNTYFSNINQHAEYFILQDFVTKTLVDLIQPPHIAINLDIIKKKIIIRGDQKTLIVLLSNLLNNAYDSMPTEGSIQIQLVTIRIDEEELDNFPNGYPGDFARVSIQDTGCGIPDHLIQKIFEPFFTTHKESKRLGLGLSMVQSIAHCHNGWIHVTSQENVGSVFHVYLPLINQHKYNVINDPSFNNVRLENE